MVQTEELPTSFTNSVVWSTDDEVIIRSNLTSIADIDSWVAEYGRLSFTKWNVRETKQDRIRVVCSKKFVCHHSSYRKKAKEENKRGHSKNSKCKALIGATVKLNTFATRRKDPFVKEGLRGVIVIRGTHNHSLLSAEMLRFLPADDATKEVFVGYFEQGMGTAKAWRHHERILADTDSSVASGRTHPSKRTVRYWFDLWRKSTNMQEESELLTRPIKEEVEIKLEPESSDETQEVYNYDYNTVAAEGSIKTEPQVASWCELVCEEES